MNDGNIEFWIQYWNAMYFGFGVIATFIGLMISITVGILVQKYLLPKKDFCTSCGKRFKGGDQ